MNSSERTISVGKKGLPKETFGFEELVEWKGPIISFGGLYTSIKYTMDGEDFHFPLIEDDDPSFGLVYWRPRDEYAPEQKYSKAIACEEGLNPNVHQY